MSVTLATLVGSTIFISVMSVIAGGKRKNANKITTIRKGKEV